MTERANGGVIQNPPTIHEREGCELVIPLPTKRLTGHVIADLDIPAARGPFSFAPTHEHKLYIVTSNRPIIGEQGDVPIWKRITHTTTKDNEE